MNSIQCIRFGSWKVWRLSRAQSRTQISHVQEKGRVNKTEWDLGTILSRALRTPIAIPYGDILNSLNSFYVSLVDNCDKARMTERRLLGILLLNSLGASLLLAGSIVGCRTLTCCSNRTVRVSLTIKRFRYHHTFKFCYNYFLNTT